MIAFVDAKNEQLDKAANDIDTRRMYEILKPIYKPSYASIGAVRDKNGRLTLSIRDSEAAISEHFAALLGGMRTSMTD